MATETTEYSIEKEQKMLIESFKMYNKSISDTEERMKRALVKETGNRKFSDKDIENQVKLLRSAQEDIVTKYVQNGGKEEDIRSVGERSGKGKLKTFPSSKSINLKSVQNNAMNDLNMIKKKKETVSESIERIIKDPSEEIQKSMMNRFIPETYDNQSSYDVIPLPSRGQCYQNKIGKIPVSYLTAYDENMIVSPNLYRDNLVLDYILRAKIMTDEIDPSELLDGDREAILLYLRASGYGNEYPIMAKDDVTGQEFETVVDLSKIKFKEFTLTGDENGYFDFDLPVSKKKVKFRFLNHSENKALDKLNEVEEKERVKEKVMYYKDDLEGYLELLDEETPAATKIKVREALNTLEDWSDGMETKDQDPYSHYLTNQMELAIVSIDGNRDREYISDFVAHMPARDSLSLRKYILSNEPGLDYKFTIEKPESLGGGSMDVFLQFDQFIFLNIPE